jgi:nucleotide-binding universal stress UspA family protein
MYRSILLANRGSIDADGALGPALALARRFDAELHMLVVMALHRLPTTMSEVNEEKSEADRRCAYIAASAERHAANVGVRFQVHLATGRLVGQVAGFVNDNKVDLLVVGPIKCSQLESMFLGDPVFRLIRAVPCAVHVLR